MTVAVHRSASTNEPSEAGDVDVVDLYTAVHLWDALVDVRDPGRFYLLAEDGRDQCTSVLEASRVDARSDAWIAANTTQKQWVEVVALT